MSSTDQWFQFLGRFHPLLVHLPIGFLFIVFLLELPFVRKKVPPMHEALVFILGVGFLSASFSCILGWMLSGSGNYDTTTLLLHQWMGICTALISGACWWLKKRKGSHTGRLYNILLSSLFIGMMLTGHWGGAMTHGEGYLSPEALLGKETQKKYERKPITNIQEAAIYADLVAPVLHEKCYNCHSAQKTRGGLRIDSEKWLLKGGKSGPAIHAGNPDDSELMIRLLLPLDDDKRMPPKKQPQLTTAETELLHWWIKNGASTEKKVKELSPDDLHIVLASLGETADNRTEEITPLSTVFDKQLPPADTAIITQLKQMGLLVEPVTSGSQLLDVSSVNFPAFDDTNMQLLEKVGPNIVSLKIDNTAISDAALEHIHAFENLVKLHLGNTAVTGASLKRLSSLKVLEYLNIVGTRVDDEGLQELSSLPALKQIYCWNAQVTSKGMAALRLKNPGINVVGGSE